MTNASVVKAVSAVLVSGVVLSVGCANGDVVTVSSDKFIRWGRSQWAEPCGREYSGNSACLVVEHCGRGAVMKVVRSI